MWRGLGLALMVLAVWPVPGFAAPRQRIDVAAAPGAFGYAVKITAAFAGARPFPEPRVEAVADAARRFCAGVGLDSPDALLIARPLDAGEMKLCRAAGVTPKGLVLGTEGLVIYAGHSGPRALSLRQLFLALAEDVPAGAGESLGSNAFMKWHQIGSSLPDAPIVVLGPAPHSPMAAMLVDLAMAPGARSFASFRRLSVAHPKAFAALVGDLRPPPAYAPLTGAADLARRVESQPGLIVIAPLTASAPAGSLAALPIDGIRPSAVNLARARHALERPVRLYIKAEHAAVMPGLTGLLDVAASEAAPHGAKGVNRLGLFAPAGARPAAALSKAAAP